MKERPILFSAPMVRALLDGTKTQTRRLVKPQPLGDARWDGNAWHATAGPGDPLPPMHCPYGQPGDRLWVREAFHKVAHPSDAGLTEKDIPRTWAEACAAAGTVIYRADPGAEIAVDGRPWSPSIHMPRSLSRILLDVTAVRAERLHDISSADILAEGIRVPVCDESGNTLVDISTPNGPGAFLTHDQYGDPDALLRAHWAALWSQINGRDSWDANPWVWVVEFKRETP